MKRERKPNRPAKARRLGTWQCLGLAGAGVLAALVLAWFWRGTSPHQPAASTGGSLPADPLPLVEPEAAVFPAYAGSAQCRDCHPAAYAAWTDSHHGLAERPFSMEREGEAFDPPRSFRHGHQTTDLRLWDGQPEVTTLGVGGVRASHRVAHVIGHDPLRQFLVPAEGGRLQVLEAAFDPRRREWFNVYGDEDRQPGEWGHWTGRGMNWNQMCASCHNTRLRKNYDAATDSYRTAMAELSVGCEACHGPMKAHVDWQRAHPDHKRGEPTLRRLTRDQVFDTCGSCHARRAELTGDFRPGEAFTDHYQLVTVDESATYYADGQVREENYEFAAFLGSRMHAAGVRCVDCHQPHSAKLILSGNALCLRCHSGGYPNSPVIDLATHTHHQPGSAGSECVNCHMPLTTYMQRHPRRDHGFTIPDPWLTMQHGVPNACNRCHTDREAAWALAAVEAWFGPRTNRPARLRAHWIAEARAGHDAARAALMGLLAGPDTPYWKASVTRLLGRWIDAPAVADAILGQVRHSHALVRAAVAHAVEPLVEAGHPAATEAINRLLGDPARQVRVAAAWVLRERVDTNSPAGRELLHALAFNADQPAGQLQLAAWQLARGDPNAALDHLQRGVQWDPYSAVLRHELAVVLSRLGRTREALEALQEAVRLEPDSAEYYFKLGLAWNELGDAPQTLSALESATRLDPRHHRAWYNLALARNAGGDVAGALEALRIAEALAPRDARIPYAVATILVRTGAIREAREALSRALAAQPDHVEARMLLRELPE
ncbi:MAG TPA: tetratricopeptide repeat protein [Methylomirabilota bacterium]|nr:tetratricopeptide repeat protein [Methylomirabilota bacterium]